MPHLDSRVYRSTYLGTVSTYQQETNMKVNIKSPIKVNITVDEEAKKKAVAAKDATLSWGRLVGRKFSAAVTSLKETK